MTRNPRAARLVLGLLSLGILVFDLKFPLGVAAGVPYVLVILLSLRLPGSFITLIFAVICTFLTYAGWHFSPEGGILWVVLTNRLLACFAIWSVAIVGLWAKRSQVMSLELQKIVDSSPVSMIAVNTNGIIVKVNREAAACFGYEQRKMEGKSTLELIPHRYREKHVQYQQKFMKAPEIRAMGQGRELFALRSNGVEFAIEIGLNPFFEADQLLVMASVIDITTKKEAAASQKNLAAIITSMDDAVMSADLNGEITAWNPAAEKLFEFSEKEAIGMPTSITIPVDGREKPFIYLQKLLDGKKVQDMEMRLQKKDGTIFDASVTMSLLVDEAQQISGLTHTVRDISQRKKLEMKLARAQKELLRSHQSLEQQVEERTEELEHSHRSLEQQVEERTKELERFVYSVSHDLKSPLVTISGYLGMVEKDALSGNHDRMKRDMKRISAAADRMKNLLDEILDLSRIGRVQNNEDKIKISEMVEEVVESLSGVIDQYHAKIIIQEQMPVVLGDRNRLMEVYQNLIENALKYSRPDVTPELEIGSRLDQEGMVFFVKDNGIGIGSRYFNKIFGLFDRIDPSSEGTGIGLAIVRRIIELHVSKIWVESEGEGSGSTFCFTLPIVSAR